MGYSGQTYRLPLANAGFRPGTNTRSLEPTDLVICRNLDFVNNGLETRGGTEKMNTTALTGAPEGRGGFDFQLSSSSHKVFATSDGKLYKNTSSTIKTGMSTANYFSFDVFDGELVVCDGDTTPQTWDGSAGSTSNLTTPAADWSGSNQPFQVITHGKGESRRAWYLYRRSAYYSVNANAKDVDSAGAGKITIATDDARDLSGGVAFQDKLFLFSKMKSYLIDDADADVANWGYQSAPWEGGAAHWRVVVKTPYDLLIMAEDGEIYSVRAAQEYGDYKAASITKESFIDAWFRDNVDLEYIEKFHACYDRRQRCVRFWVVRSGQTTPDTCLKFYVDRSLKNAWSLDDNLSTSSGFKAACSYPCKDTDGIFRIYTVDHAGFQWRLGASSRSDEGNAYYTGFKIAPNFMENPRIRKHFRRLLLSLRHYGTHAVNVRVGVDGQTASMQSIESGEETLAFSWAFPVTFSDPGLFEQKIDFGSYGKWIDAEVYTNGENEGFFCGDLQIDFKPTGVLAS